MDGAHNQHGWNGYDEIPMKDQPEPVYNGDVSPWPEEWEGPFAACYSLTSALFERNPFPLNNNLDMARWGARRCIRATMRTRPTWACGWE